MSRASGPVLTAQTESASARATRSTDVAVIILTRNEEQNLPQALTSVCRWAAQVFVFDSYSTDRTLDVARQFGCEVVQHAFVDYSKQRNAALDELPIRAEWVLFLDADEWLSPELKAEITSVLARGPGENGFYIKRRLIWMGKWIRRGYYPTWILRLFRYGKGHCEARTVNEHIVVDGPVGQLQHDLIHEDHRDVSDWVAKHNRYAIREAEELFRANSESHLPARLLGTQAERKRWLRESVWTALPPLVRPALYYGYRYVLKGGFLDGRAGFMYHFLQALWFPMLIDIKYLEMKQRSTTESL